MKMVAMIVMIGLGFDENDKNFFELVEMARDVVLGGSLLFTQESGGVLNSPTSCWEFRIQVWLHIINVSCCR